MDDFYNMHKISFLSALRGVVDPHNNGWIIPDLGLLRQEKKDEKDIADEKHSCSTGRR